MRLDALHILSQISFHKVTARKAEISPFNPSHCYPSKDISRAD